MISYKRKEDLRIAGGLDYHKGWPRECINDFTHEEEKHWLKGWDEAQRQERKQELEQEEADSKLDFEALAETCPWRAVLTLDGERMEDSEFCGAIGHGRNRPPCSPATCAPWHFVRALQEKFHG